MASSLAVGIRQYGVAEDRTREQFTAQVMRHPKGKPGHVYVAEVVAQIRADSLDQLQTYIDQLKLGDAYA